MRNRGFTLIELMIVVAIVAIISAVALPSYNNSIAKSRRAEARGQLLETAQFMQRFYSQNDSFSQDRGGKCCRSTDCPGDCAQDCSSRCWYLQHQFFRYAYSRNVYCPGRSASGGDLWLQTNVDRSCWTTPAVELSLAR